MKRSVGRRVRDALLACAGLGLLLAGIVIINEDARHLLLGAVQGDFQIGAMVDTRVFSLMYGIKDVAHTHQEMTTFGVAGFFLFVLMFKLM